MKRLINIFYTSPFKFLIFFVATTCVWSVNSCFLEAIDLYSEDSTAFVNVLKQNEKYDYMTSYFLEEDIENTIKNVLDYCLIYSEQTEIDYMKELSVFDSEIMISSMIYLAESYIEDGVYNEHFIDSGFITVTETGSRNANLVYEGRYFYQSVDEEVIRSAYKAGSTDFIESYHRSIDKNYRMNAEYLEGLENFTFAVVNHTDGIIISNIEEIHRQKEDIQVRPYFGENEENLLVVREAKTPLFEQGPLTGYVDEVAALAKEYEDNFDLYISFGEDFDFVKDRSTYESRHREAYSEIKDLLGIALPLLVISVILGFVYIFLTGKYEAGGKFHGNVFDRIPNDIIVIMYLMIIFSVASLYENSIYVVFRAAVDENYWLSFPLTYYKFRAGVCLVSNSVISVAIISTLKRQWRLGTLISNTYLYKTVKNYLGNR